MQVGSRNGSSTLFGPFDQHENPKARHVAQSQFFDLRRSLHPIQIYVHVSPVRNAVGVDQGVRRTAHRRGDPECMQHAARTGGLAAAQFTVKMNDCASGFAGARTGTGKRSRECRTEGFSGSAVG